MIRLLTLLFVALLPLAFSAPTVNKAARGVVIQPHKVVVAPHKVVVAPPPHNVVVTPPHHKVFVPHAPVFVHPKSIVPKQVVVIPHKPVVVDPPAPPTPPPTVAPPPPPAPPTTPPPPVHPSLVELLSAPEFSILVKLVTDTGLLSSLLVADHITIFAPTNKAFIATASDLCGPVSTADAAIACFSSLLTVKQIKAVLLYHVLPVTLFSKQIFKLTIFETLNGAIIKRKGIKLIDIAKGIEDPKLDVLDIKFKGGVIHVITRVLLPFKIIVEVAKAPIVVR